MAQELSQKGIALMVPGRKYAVKGYMYKGIHVLLGPATVQLSLDGDTFVETPTFSDQDAGALIELPGFINFVRIASDSTAEVLLSAQHTGVAG